MHIKASLLGLLLVCILVVSGCITGNEAAQDCAPCPTGGTVTILESSAIDADTIASLRAQLVALRSESLAPDGAVALVRMYGVLDSEDVGMAYDLFDRLGKDANIGAVVLWLDSPGGGVGATVDLYQSLTALRAHKPVVVYSGGMIASGGYYLSLGADAIVVGAECLVGNIGVIYVHTDASQYYRDFGLRITVIKTGAFKDMGADWRALTSEEYAWLEASVMDSYNRFVRTVALERDMTSSEALAMADGSIWLATEAYEAGMVDTVGTLDDAVALAASYAGIDVVERWYYEVWDEGSLKAGSVASPLRYQWEETIEAFP